VISMAQPALAQTITGGFNIDIIEGNVTYESGGATALTATDLGISSQIPTDLAQEILNGESVDGFFVSPVNLSLYAAANLTQFPSVSDAYFVDQGNASAGEPGAFLDHNGNVTTAAGYLTDSDMTGLITADLGGLLPGYSVASSTLVLVDSEQYFVDYAALGDNAPDMDINYLTYNIVESAPDGGATALLLGLPLLGLILGRSLFKSKSVG
jgi:hypothetical protein